MLSSCCHGNNRHFPKHFWLRDIRYIRSQRVWWNSTVHTSTWQSKKRYHISPCWKAAAVQQRSNSGYFFFLGLLFHLLSVHKTSKITRSKAAVPGGGTFSNLPAAHSWTLSHLKALREICSALYSFHNNVRNKCRKMRNKALCYVSLRRKLHRRISDLKLNGTRGLLSWSTCTIRCTPRC